MGISSARRVHPRGTRAWPGFKRCFYSGRACASSQGFLTKGNMQKPETVSYLTSQVVSIMLIRSLGAKDAITLENGLDVVEGQ